MRQSERCDLVEFGSIDRVDLVLAGQIKSRLGESEFGAKAEAEV